MQIKTGLKNVEMTKELHLTSAYETQNKDPKFIENCKLTISTLELWTGSRNLVKQQCT